MNDPYKDLAQGLTALLLAALALLVLSIAFPSCSSVKHTAEQATEERQAATVANLDLQAQTSRTLDRTITITLDDLQWYVPATAVLDEDSLTHDGRAGDTARSAAEPHRPVNGAMRLTARRAVIEASASGKEQTNVALNKRDSTAQADARHTQAEQSRERTAIARPASPLTALLLLLLAAVAAAMARRARK